MQLLRLACVALVCLLTACRSPSKTPPIQVERMIITGSPLPVPSGWTEVAVTNSPTRASSDLVELKRTFDETIAAVEAEFKKQFDATRVKADAGDPKAQCELARMFERGQGVPADQAQAVQWLERSAGQGWPEAQCALGRHLSQGQGVAVDPAAALRLYHQADAQGYPSAAWAIGECHHEGLGTRKDPREALRWYRRSAELGDPICQRNLAGILASGSEGIDKNVSEAVQWVRRAAVQGDAFAQVELGRRYAEGDGVRRDLVEAHMWFDLAAARTKFSRVALSVSLARLEKQMTAPQIAAAKRRAQEFRARPEPSATGAPSSSDHGN